MSRYESTSSVMATLATIALIVVIICGWTFVSYQEARSFSKLTGGNATTWDAMFTQLRVQGVPVDE